MRADLLAGEKVCCGITIQSIKHREQALEPSVGGGDWEGEATGKSLETDGKTVELLLPVPISTASPRTVDRNKQTADKEWR